MVSFGTNSTLLFQDFASNNGFEAWIHLGRHCIELDLEMGLENISMDRVVRLGWVRVDHKWPYVASVYRLDRIFKFRQNVGVEFGYSGQWRINRLAHCHQKITYQEVNENGWL